jgi:hypothetical protein
MTYKKTTRRSNSPVRNGNGAAVAERPASTFNETLTVDGVSNKFGNGAILVGKEWINLNDGVSLDDIVKGDSYEFEIKMGTNGKRYINAVLSGGSSAGEPETATAEVVEKSAVRIARTPSAKKTDQFRSPDEIKRSSAIGIAGGSELYKKMLEDAGNVDDAKGMLADCADFILKYIETGSCF